MLVQTVLYVQYICVLHQMLHPVMLVELQSQVFILLEEQVSSVTVHKTNGNTLCKCFKSVMCAVAEYAYSKVSDKFTTQMGLEKWCNSACVSMMQRLMDHVSSITIALLMHSISVCHKPTPTSAANWFIKGRAMCYPV